MVSMRSINRISRLWNQRGQLYIVRHLLIPLNLGEGLMADNLERPERLQVMLNAEEFRALDTWRFERRMPSRAAAVRELLRRGLAAEGFLEADSGSHSADFGILDRPPGG